MQHPNTYTENSTWLRTNGNSHAFARELGCHCGRCRTIEFNMARPSGKLEPFAGWTDPPCRAATSVSILTSDAKGDVKGHFLMDGGPVVGDSLADSLLSGLEHLGGVAISHWHPDHVRGLNPIGEAVRRACKLAGMAFVKIPLYTTLATYKWLRERGGLAYELDRLFAFIELIPGQRYRVQETPSIDIVGIEVAHGGIEGAVIFVAEVGEERKKVTFCWDIDRPDRQRPSDKMTNLDALRANAPLLRHSEVLYVAVNTYAVDEGIGHTSFLNAMQYVDEVAAKQVYCLHMSGHEDGPGNPGYGLDDSGWDRLIQQHLPSASVARQGMITRL